MEKRATDKIEDLGVAETPEDVAVLYSWANLHGAKYRDFSASRREYRAQLRHRAAEQVRQQALMAQAEAEAAAEAAEAAARKAAETARTQQGSKSDSTVRMNLKQAEEAARTAAAERVEAARRAEAAATADAVARREEREIVEAHASAERQAARYAESELRLRQAAEHGYATQGTLPGRISDPYTPHAVAATPAINQAESAPQIRHAVAQHAATQHQHDSSPPPRFSTQPPVQPQSQAASVTSGSQPFVAQIVESLPVRNDSVSQRRRQGYHPDDASGVRQIYRGPENAAAVPERRATDRGRTFAPVEEQPLHERRTVPQSRSESGSDSSGNPPSGAAGSGAGSAGSGTTGSSGGRPYPPQPNSPMAPQVKPSPDPLRGQTPRTEAVPVEAADIAPPPPVASSHSREDAPIASFWEPSRPAEKIAGFDLGSVPNREPAPGSASPAYPVQPPLVRPVSEAASPRPVSPFSQPLATESVRGRRAQDDLRYERTPGFTDISYAGSVTQQPSPVAPQNRQGTSEPIEQGVSYPSDPAGPAWLYAPAGGYDAPPPSTLTPPVLPSVAETLQHSRERVAARWFALKGVFEQPGELAEPAPIRQKEIRTPVLAVFSLAGGVGKTSLVATIGRSLSSLGEKVLLTDTTSHGLLPFYFGASELRQGSVRTFSPPSGSTDAPIYLVSYEVGSESAEPDKGKLVEEIIDNSRGTHRILLDLTVNSAWIIRHMARMSPTILVPLAPDMNSVISLQAIEKFFQGMVDGDGLPLQPYYIINQFDVSLPLHLDVREVLRRQLGDRLLPFVIHRAPEVSEALAEGMTVVDYTPESPVSGDYMNVATWLRTIAAPATAGFRNVRWSER